jgi:hypothetical protein
MFLAILRKPIPFHIPELKRLSLALTSPRPWTSSPVLSPVQELLGHRHVTTTQIYDKRRHYQAKRFARRADLNSYFDFSVQDRLR